MIRYLDNRENHIVSFIPSDEYSVASYATVEHEDAEHLIGFNFENKSGEGERVTFTFSGTYDISNYINNALSYLKAALELEDTNQQLYEEWIKELEEIKLEVLKVDTLLPAYEAIYGTET